MKRIHAAAVGVVAVLSLAVVAVAFAQPAGGMGPGFGPGMGHGPMADVDPATQIDAHLADLKTQIKINTPQEGAWQVFTAAAKRQAAGMQAMRAQMQQDPASAPDRMAQRATVMQQRSEAMATMTNAFNALYSVLTPEQKAIADQSVGMMGRGGMRFGPRAS
jgi:protein CpxP